LLGGAGLPGGVSSGVLMGPERSDGVPVGDRFGAVTEPADIGGLCGLCGPGGLVGVDGIGAVGRFDGRPVGVPPAPGAPWSTIT
jgi:hypothetical protein